jgi:aspartyl-tRNA(Asn)/glutamyl-tRNA(Gln) amidotransferase subunit B
MRAACFALLRLYIAPAICVYFPKIVLKLFLPMEYELIVGLEVHCQLNTKTKAFCGCSTAFGAPANTNVCPVCLALPGSLPVLNKKVLEYAVRLGLTTNCQIRLRSIFARKNYFYPDLPKGYQISQYDEPICFDGHVDYELDGVKKTVRLIRIHIEEDAGKSIHDIGSETYIDVNRCGVPLLEIVSYPDIRSTKEASAYLQKLRQIVRWIGISDGNMEEGSLRCDANVSIRPKGLYEVWHTHRN